MAATGRKHGSCQLMPFPPNSSSYSLTPHTNSGSTNASPNSCIKQTIQNNASPHNWLNAMRKLSPPRIRQSQKNLKSQPNSVLDDIQYSAWMALHPSAFEKFYKAAEAAMRGKHIVVFLDYDGTLSPIVDDPDAAFMSDEMRSAVRDIASLFPTAIITGRSKEKVYEFVQLPELFYAGSHGMDITGPTSHFNSVGNKCSTQLYSNVKAMIPFQAASEFRVVMNEIFKILEDKIKNINGAKIEHNKLCITVHFRCVKEEDWLPLAEQVENVISSFPELRLTQGRKVLEIRPPIEWNKGKAVNYLLKALGPEDRNNVFPIYIGDDKSDEDAFKVLSRWKLGMGILVSSTVKDTNAKYSLHNTNEVLEFLRHLINWRNGHLGWVP